MNDLYRQRTDAFFYDNYSLVWEGAQPKEMVAVYVTEMDNLFYCLENGEDYRQEIATDYPLAQKLRVLVDGKYQIPQRRHNAYVILPAKGVVLFQQEGKIVYQCSYRKFFQILEFYVRSLQQKFPMEIMHKRWSEQMKSLKRGRWKSQLSRMKEKLQFRDHSVHFEGAKELTLGPKDIVSFRQLKCQDTLRYLVVEGLTGFRDLDVLGEYTQLKTLYLRDMGLQDISFLASMKNLTELGLPGNQIRDLSPLVGLEKLESIYIAGNPVQDFSVVEHLPALKSLYVDLKQLPDQLAWESIPVRICLRVLQLTLLDGFRYSAETVYFRPADISVKQSTDPRKLNVKDRWLYSGMINALGYQPAVKYDVAKLKQLDCSDSIQLCDNFLFLTEMGDYSCLESAVNLRKLNLSGRVVKEYSWLRKCVNLREVDLSQTDFSDLELMAEMKQLTSLNLSGCHNLKEDSLQLLKHLTKLKRLNLSNTHVRYLEGLERLDRLEFLNLEDCECLEGVEQMLEILAEIPHLYLPDQEGHCYCQAVFDFFCQGIEARGFLLHVGGTGVLPEPLASRYEWIPQDWQDFLQQVSSCVSRDGNTWFLTRQDYQLHPEIKFPWEQIELDDEWQTEPYRESWKEYLPILVSIAGSEPEYYALSLENSAVICVKGKMLEKASLAAHSLQQFLYRMVKEPLKGKR